ncbi:conjugative transposon protein TraM [Sabulibacter ruber]|uniref:conjugative transposon protein TraM n=1 Tax=Sabulibacter ruber TaxID=2811901 RepID=UPI001A9791BD|nr:conjugative transposon protein TraM [Sabulibacter ruber]
MEDLREDYPASGTGEPHPAGDREDPPVRRQVAGLLRKHWFTCLLALVVLLFLGLFLWLRAARNAARENLEPVAAASENIEQAIPEAATEGIERKSPSALLEEQRKAEQEARYAPPAPSEEEVVGAFAVDTAGQAARRSRARLEQAPTAAADPAHPTEPESAPTAHLPREGTGPGMASRAAEEGAVGERNAQASHDTDGTPFETNPEILRMLSASSPQTRQVYEQTTGRRYRDPGTRGGKPPEIRQAPPGTDGFHTYKAAGGRPEGGTRGPEVFFRGVVSGEQKVRSGSVVTLRLLEDAVIAGVTFPRNTVFAGVAKVESNRVSLRIDRLGPVRVRAEVYDLHYLPGIMIDPEKRIEREVDRGFGDLQRQAGQEISTAIDRSATGANSVVGVAGRVAATVVSRPRANRRLREVLLPDGYPILVSPAEGDPGDGTR